MKVIRVCTLIVALAVGMMVVSAVRSSADDSATLDMIEDRLGWIEYRLAVEQWRVMAEGRSDSLRFFEDLYTYTLANADIRSLARRVKSGSSQEALERRANLVEDLALRFVVDGHLPSSGVLDTIRRLADEQVLRFDGERVSSTELELTVANDPVRARREQAWRALNSGEGLTEDMGRLFRLRNQQARREGFNNYFNLLMSTRSNSIEWYAEILSELDRATGDAYRSVLTRLKSRLRVDRIEPWDLEYAFADIRSSVDGRLIADTIQPLVSATFDSIGVDLDQLPIYTAFRDSTMAPAPPRAFDVQPPFDLRVGGSITGGHDNLRATLAAYGEAMYGCHIHQEEPLFNRPLDGAFSESVRCLFEMFADSPRWLSEVAGLPEQLTADFVSARRDLALIELRHLLVLAHFELEAYKDATQDLTRLYWNLVERYMQLPRHDEMSPWAQQLDYAFVPGAFRDRLVGRIIAAQSWDYIQRINGSVIDNRDTRSFLIQNYFRFGRRYAWPELVKRGTGEALHTDALTAWLGL
ncbi:hypothetical protein KQH51_03525 [bacterium]|nr:hypothetical protein [bacterium]MCB2201992.1 hypothetical protein [bacterium]